MHPRFDRLLVCLPSRGPVEQLLSESARFAGLLPPSVVEVVAAPVHGLHDRRRDAVRAAFGREVDGIHLVPDPEQTVDLALTMADRSSVVITAPASRRRLPRRPVSSTLVIDRPLSGGSVLALVDPQRDTIAAVSAAIDLARGLEASRVVACDVYFDEGAAACDAWEQRTFEERSERLDIFLSRVPACDGVTVTTRVIQSSYAERTIARLAAEETAALVVGRGTPAVDVPVLSLPDAVAERSVGATGLHARWLALRRRLPRLGCPA